MMAELVRIHYKDDDLVIVEKPVGISTQPLTSPYTPSLVRRGTGGGRIAPTLAHLVAESYPEIKSVGGTDWGAAHRLDRDTSGLVVFARNEISYRRLREMFSKNQVEREYTALVEGTVDNPGRIDWPIGADPKSAKKVKAYKNIKEARRAGAQEAITLYAPLSDHRGEGSVVRGTVLRVTIKTGRRHQIRAHLAAIGHPVLRLHASRLRFQHPRADPNRSRWVEVSSPAAFASGAASLRSAL